MFTHKILKFLITHPFLSLTFFFSSYFIFLNNSNIFLSLLSLLNFLFENSFVLNCLIVCSVYPIVLVFLLYHCQKFQKSALGFDCTGLHVIHDRSSISSLVLLFCICTFLLCSLLGL